MSGPRPWSPSSDEQGDVKRHAPATARNRDAITNVLRGVLPAAGSVLEIASGSGEHAVHFARAFPALSFLPSDREPPALASIAAWTQEAQVKNVEQPVLIDCTLDAPWPIAAVEAILCINMVHISPWEAPKGLFVHASAHLAKGAPLYLYGPYFEESFVSAESNLAFDQSLKAMNPAFGIRHLNDVDALAGQHGFTRDARIEMPANNLSLVYRKG